MTRKIMDSVETTIKRPLLYGASSIFLLLIAIFTLSVPMISLNLTKNLIAGLLMTAISEILVIVFVLKMSGNNFKNWRKVFRVSIPENKTYLVIAPFIGLILFVLLQLISVILYSQGIIVGSSDTSTSISSEIGLSRIAALGFLVPFFIPFVEELFFRGYVFGFLRYGFKRFSKLKGVLGFIVSAIISSFYFAILHSQGFSKFSDFFLIGYIFIIALVNSFLVEKTNSIIPGFIVHCVYNGMTAVVMLLSLGG